MRVVYSYGRLFLASWLFMAGLALQVGPSPAAVARDARWRERELQSIAADQQTKWIVDQDVLESRHQAYVRVLGVVLGGLGFAAALREAAYLSGRFGR